MKIELICACITCAISICGVYFKLSSNAIAQASRIKALELELSFQKEKMAEHSKRLDNHDIQNQALISLSEQVISVKEDIKELKNMFKEKYNEN